MVLNVLYCDIRFFVLFVGFVVNNVIFVLN